MLKSVLVLKNIIIFGYCFKMKRFLCGLVFLLGFVVGYAQQNQIFIQAKITENNPNVKVSQEIDFSNSTDRPLNQIKLLNWIAAYQSRNTALLGRKLEDRKSDLYFAKPHELGSLENLEIRIGDQLFDKSHSSEQNIFLPLEKSLQPGEVLKITLNYTLRIPSAKFTDYGIEGNRFYLKYFFIVPDHPENTGNREFLDIDENESPGNNWTVILDVPANWNVKSNLKELQPNYFQGILNNDPEFMISEKRFDQIYASVDGKVTLIDFGYSLTSEEKQHLEFYLPLQLSFIKNKIGSLPDKVFITEKFKKDQNFTGLEDLKFWKLRYPLFPQRIRTDLNYFSAISKNIIQQSVIFDKNEDHWLINGLKTYLEIQYLDRYYRDEKLLGALPENLKLFGLKPLKIFHASELKLSERYGLAYQYIMNQNLDQRIAEPFYQLSNFNGSAISHFEMGSLFSFLAEKMGNEKFDDFITDYLKQNAHNKVDQKDFLDRLTLATGYSSEFLEQFLQRKNRVNFDLKKFKKIGDEFQVKISKNTDQQIPFKLETISKEGEKSEFWFDTDHSRKAIIYNIPQANAEKIVVNSEYIFPENNFRDNYLYTKGIYANAKKVKLKLFKDIPNPEFNEIYLNPRLSFNAYDNILLGLNFRNTSLFEQKFNYTFTPYFSSGTGTMTGSGGISYSFQPAESFYRSLDFGITGSYFHYDFDLSYRKLTLFGNLSFSKNPRSDIGRSLGISYNFFDRDLNPKKMDQDEYSRYNLWSVGYAYSDRRMIHEKYFSGNFLFMEDFQRISAEAFYRWEFQQNKKISFRLFGGLFLNNHTRNNLFDYGISKVSNFAFSYGLLGQSATSGIFSQQLIIADGGFKSYFGQTANQWITAVNVDGHLWKMFNLYADAGLYKNHHFNPKFIWDSGVKLKVVPDFLEVYFPVQSSLGFEPSFKDYGTRIRFTLTVNFSALTNYFRRGWF